MNRENKRKTFEKCYYKTHNCTDSFYLQSLRSVVYAAGCGQWAPQPLSQLPV